MSAADVLRRAGFCPQVINHHSRTDDVETVVLQCRPFESTQNDEVKQECSETGCNRLLALAEAEGVDDALVHELPEDDVAACAALPDSALRAFLHARQASADRMAGRIPTGETAPILCVHCGPVWSHPEVAAVLPVVGGWPRALGCPWCVVRAAGRYISRPPVTSATCAHFVPDTANPGAGMGECRCGWHYPGKRHRCRQSEPGATS